jgi:hypothetical protein
MYYFIRRKIWTIGTDNKFFEEYRTFSLFGLKYSFPTHLKPKIWLILVHPKIQKLSWIQKYVYSHGQRRTHHLVLSNKLIQESKTFTYQLITKLMCSGKKITSVKLSLIQQNECVHGKTLPQNHKSFNSSRWN